MLTCDKLSLRFWMDVPQESMEFELCAKVISIGRAVTRLLVIATRPEEKKTRNIILWYLGDIVFGNFTVTQQAFSTLSSSRVFSLDV